MSREGGGPPATRTLIAGFVDLGLIQLDEGTELCAGIAPARGSLIVESSTPTLETSAGGRTRTCDLPHRLAAVGGRSSQLSYACEKLCHGLIRHQRRHPTWHIRPAYDYYVTNLVNRIAPLAPLP